MMIFNSSFLYRSKYELKEIAMEIINISYYLQLIHQSVDKLIEIYSSANKTFNQSFHSYSNLLSEEGSESSLKEDLLILMTIGIPSPSLLRFFSRSLSSEPVSFFFFLISFILFI